MVFSSTVFLFVFLPITLIFYFFIRNDFKNVLLLVASLFFYAWGEFFYLFVMLLSILLNYLFGLFLSHTIKKNVSRFWVRFQLFIAVLLNLLLLAYFKYANFIVENLSTLLEWWQSSPISLEPVHLPIGISFFTFQAISYLVDVYREEAEAQKNPLNCALYISLFPQLIAGPIVRYHDVALQLKERSVDIQKFSSGVRRFIFGLSKKLLIANPLGEIADMVFGLSGVYLSAGLSWLGIVCYALQIYFDFSGYSDMAIGLGRMFGFDFLENFNYPYISKSIKEFWRRWHISLSTWFRDYLYIPLGGNQKSVLRTYINLWIVFLLCGLWHGASWNFLIWGALHGFYLVVERLGFGRLLERLPSFFQHCYTLFLVLIGWVFFRAETLPEASTYLKSMFGFGMALPTRFDTWMLMEPKIILILLFGVLLSSPLAVRVGQGAKTKAEGMLSNFVLDFLLMLMTLGLFYLCLMSVASGTYNPFIYFRF